MVSTPDNREGRTPQPLSTLGDRLLFPPREEWREAGSGRTAAAAEKDDRQTAEGVQRADMLAKLDAELAELTRTIGAVRTLTPSANDPYLQSLETRAGDLGKLREQVESASSLSALIQLRQQVTEAVRTGADATTIAQATTGVTGGVFNNRMVAEAQYHARMSNIERTVAELTRQDARSFGQTEAFARDHGIDISAYRSQRAALESEADEKERQGDRYGALTARNLNLWNSYYSAVAVADGIDGTNDPQAKAAAQRNADAARIAAERGEQQQRKAAEANAAKEAAGMQFPGGEHARDQWIKAKVQADMDAYQGRKAEMPKPKSVSEDQTREYRSVISAEVLNEMDKPAAGNVAVEDTDKDLGYENRDARRYAGFAENHAAPYQHDGARLPAAATEQARRAAAPVAQDTAAAQATDEAAKTPGATPNVKVAEAATAKTTVTI